MNIQVPFKPKIIIILLSIAAVMNILPLFCFIPIESIVHGDLYNYGLQFSQEWVTEYWSLSFWLATSLKSALICFIASIASIIIYIRAHTDSWRLICYLFMVAGVVSTLFSGYIFTNVDYFTRHDLYQYGLQISYDWTINYLMYARLILGFIILAIATGLLSATLLFLSPKKQIRVNPTKLTYSTLIATGIIAFILSLVYTSSILAFIGLGLIFWGIIIAYIRTEEYIKSSLLDSTTLSALETLNQVMKELNYKGKPVYLPPKYLATPEACKVFIPKQEEGKLPNPKHIQRRENKFFLENSNGILLTPPGAELAKLFEKTLETSFVRTNLEFLQKNMPKLFIEDLEIAQSFQMQIENNKIHVKIENSAYKNLNEKTEKLLIVRSLLGCPVNSAIACALAKATGKPILIESQKTSEDGKQTEIEYSVLEEEQTEK